MGKNYKYVISAFIMQKNGAGAHTAAGLFWDGQKDGALGLCDAREGRSRAPRPQRMRARTHRCAAR